MKKIILGTLLLLLQQCLFAQSPDLRHQLWQYINHRVRTPFAEKSIGYCQVTTLFRFEFKNGKLVHFSAADSLDSSSQQIVFKENAATPKYNQKLEQIINDEGFGNKTLLLPYTEKYTRASCPTVTEKNMTSFFFFEGKPIFGEFILVEALIVIKTSSH